MRQYQSLDQAFTGELARVLADGDPVSPRGMGSLELSGCTFRLADPRARVITNPARRWSLPYAIGELCWHLSRSGDLDQISYYSKRWKDYADAGDRVTGSCYGLKLFAGGPKGTSQWEQVKEVLSTDPGTRRAVLTVLQSTDLATSVASRDVPCCCSLQFLLRDGALNLIAHMRSNDLFTGFGYDIFFFTMLQELLARELGVELGWYQHFAGSLHLYDKDRAAAERIIDARTEQVAMPSLVMPSDVERVLDYEQGLRSSDVPDPSMNFDVAEYWRPFVGTLLFHRLRKAKDRSGMSKVLSRFEGNWCHPLLELLT